MAIYNKPDVLPAWAESGDVVQPSNAEIQEGWPFSTVPPSRQRFNWVLNWAANAVRYFMQRGIPAWDTDEDYPLAGRVQHAGVTWVAILANTNVEPGTDPTRWERWGFTSSELNAFLDPITPDPVNNRVGINNLTPAITLDIVATDAVKLPSGTTAQRPTGQNGLIRHNSTLNQIEAWISGAWAQIGGTIPDASETVKGIVEKATAAEAQAFTADKYIDGARLVSAFQGANQSLAASGYQRLPGGLIIQWVTGASSSGGEGSSTVTLPITFPNGTLIAFASLLNPTANGAADTTYQVVSFTASAVTVYRQQNPGNTVAASPIVFAIGN